MMKRNQELLCSAKLEPGMELQHVVSDQSFAWLLGKIFFHDEDEERNQSQSLRALFLDGRVELRGINYSIKV